MARTAFFGRRAGTKSDSTEEVVPVDEVRPVDAESPTIEQRDRTIEERVSEDRTVPQRVVREDVVRKDVVRKDQDRDLVPPVAPAPERDITPVVAPRAARVSLAATLGLMVGVAAAAATFTGRLAWLGVAAGVLAILISLVGVAAGARPHVAGRGLGTLGVLFGVVAVGFGVLAMTHTASWLDSNVDTVGQIRNWFDTQLPFTKSW